MDTTTWLCGPPPSTGQRQRFPGRFLHNLYKNYDLSGRGLWLFSGSIEGREYDDTLDMRPETGAKFQIPFTDMPRMFHGNYDFVVADPPYTVGFTQDWTKEEDKVAYPKKVLEYSALYSKVGGLIFILHILIIPAYKVFGVKRVALHPILCGPNNSIRVLNVFRKE